MKICVSCKKEMLCKENGVPAVWGQTHAYFGDLFECPQCKVEILVCSKISTHINAEKVKAQKKTVINMTPESK